MIILDLSVKMTIQIISLQGFWGAQGYIFCHLTPPPHSVKMKMKGRREGKGEKKEEKGKKRDEKEKRVKKGNPVKGKRR